MPNWLEKQRLAALESKYGKQLKFERYQPFTYISKFKTADVRYNFEFTGRTKDFSFYATDCFVSTIFLRFRILEDKFDAKLLVDKLIWVKEERRFYPEWVIIDKNFNVYNIFDYV